MTASQPLDLLSCELDGTSLIEASAGTGKTYALSGLYLRLVLERDVTVPEILVVTFTEAATEELKGRIREKLRQALNQLDRGGDGEPFIIELIARQPDRSRARDRLQRALRCFDEAAITTIHGFCHRVLREHAFESGGPFEIEIVPDDHLVLQTLVEDYWRVKVQELPAVFLQTWPGTENPVPAWLKLARLFFGRPGLDWVPRCQRPDCAEPERRLLDVYRELRRRWPKEAEQIAELLTDDRVFNQNNYKKQAIAGWIQEVAAYLGVAEPPRGGGRSEAEDDADLLAAAVRKPPERFAKFTPAQITAGVKKGQVPPVHPLFSLCQRLQSDHQALADCYQTTRIALTGEFFTAMAKRLAERKRRSGERCYVDLLTDLRDALAGAGGEALAEAVRRRYRAALIDEFQDTDPVQYAIFDRLFRTERHTLVLIGDPKQAIYAFRGADLFAYLKAAAHSRRKYYLTDNWRSDPVLIRACNTLFTAHQTPFLFPDIEFQPVAPAPKTDRPALTLDGASLPAMELWWVDPRELRPEAEEDQAGGGKREKKFNKAEAEEAIRRAVAADIARLLKQARSGRLRLGERPVRERDFAVLVRKNLQAQALQRELSRLGIASVVYQSGSLFESAEALEVQRVLAAVLEPGREAAVRAALAGPLIGCDAAELVRLQSDERAWGKWLERFHRYQERWLKAGFMPMFRAFLGDQKVLVRLMRRPNGERAVTNLLHLAELLHAEARSGGRGPAELLAWLVQRRNDSGDGNEEHLLRMETDESAVRLITMHKSKGLEFPLVYCPFCWEDPRAGTDNGDAMILCHDPDNRDRLILDLGDPDWERHAAQAFAEDLAEGLRLLYVAVTRAQHRCVLVWGELPGSRSSAPAYLIHGGRRPENAAGPAGAAAAGAAAAGAAAAAAPSPGSVAAALGKVTAGIPPAELRADVEALAASAGGAIAVEPLPNQPAAPPPAVPTDPPAELTARVFSGQIDRSWRLASFSGLVSNRPEDREALDRDQLPAATLAGAGPGMGLIGTAQAADRPAAANANAPVGGGVCPASRPSAPDIFSFPRGARAGTVLHAVFEELDFQCDLDAQGRTVTAAVLGRYGFDPIWIDPVLDMVKRVLAAPLLAEQPDFILGRIGREERLSELEFHFPIERLEASGLNRFLDDYQQGAARLPAGAVPGQRLGALTFSPAQGFMKGFIDLVFRHDGRFYLLDWKSNHLGDRIEAYQGEALAQAMIEHNYVLQYLIYTAALDRYLALRLADYRYDEHFGGVFYVFLRGVDPDRGPGFGIYHDRPDRARVRELMALFHANDRKEQR